MQTGTDGPDDNGDNVTAFRAQPVDNPSGEERDEGVKNGEGSDDVTIIVVVPMELRGNKVLPRQREYLAVQVVDGGGYE